MKHFRTLSKLKVGLSVALLAVFGGAAFIQHSLAATGQIYLSPGSTSLTEGSSTTLSLRINPGTSVDGIEATISYDKSKLQYVSLNSGGSAFPIELSPNGGGNGTVRVTRGHLTGTVNNDALIAKVTFKALAGSGSTNVSASGNASSAGSYTNPGGGSATINFTTPSTPTPPSPPADDPSDPSTPDNPGSDGSSSDGGGDNSGGDSSGGGEDSGGQDKPAPNPANVKAKVQRVGFTKALLEVTSDKNVRAYIKYGVKQDKLNLTSRTTDLGRKHVIRLDDKLLFPGTTYYYKAVAEDGQGNKSETAVQDFKTKGIRCRLLLRDRLGRLLKRKKVTLFSEPMTGTTNDKGEVFFEDVTPGKHHIEYEQDGQTYSAVIEVSDKGIETNDDDTQSADLQDHAVFFSELVVSNSALPQFVLPTVVAVAVLAAAGGAAFVIIRRKSGRGLATQAPSATPYAPTGQQGPQDSNELINRVEGQNKPGPGSVVNPGQEDEKDK